MIHREQLLIGQQARFTRRNALCECSAAVYVSEQIRRAACGAVYQTRAHAALEGVMLLLTGTLACVVGTGTQRTVTETVVLSGHSFTSGQMVVAGWEQLVMAVQLAAVTMTGFWAMCRIHVKFRCDSCASTGRGERCAGAGARPKAGICKHATETQLR